MLTITYSSFEEIKCGKEDNVVDFISPMASKYNAAWEPILISLIHKREHSYDDEAQFTIIKQLSPKITDALLQLCPFPKKAYLKFVQIFKWKIPEKRLTNRDYVSHLMIQL